MKHFDLNEFWFLILKRKEEKKIVLGLPSVPALKSFSAVLYFMAVPCDSS